MYDAIEIYSIFLVMQRIFIMSRESSRQIILNENIKSSAPILPLALYSTLMEKIAE